MEQVADGVNYLDLIIKLFQAFKIYSTITNPVGALIGLVVTAAVTGLIGLLVRNWIRNKEADAAKQITDKEHQDLIEHEIPKNTEKNETDNANLDKAKDL